MCLNFFERQEEAGRVPAALRVRFLRTACPTCWLLDVSRLIASRMVFRAQGESPASCTRPDPGRIDAATCHAKSAANEKHIGNGNPVAASVRAQASNRFVEADAARPPNGCCPAAKRMLPGRWAAPGAAAAFVRAAAARPLGGCCGSSRAASARPHHSETEPENSPTSRSCTSFSVA